MNSDRGTITIAMPNGHIKMITSYNQDIRKTMTAWQKCIDHIPHLCVNKIKDIDSTLKSLRDPHHPEYVQDEQQQFVFGSTPQ